MVRDELPKAAKRLSECGYRPNDSVVQLKLIPGAGVAFVSGVMRCHSVWLCPCCAPEINETRKVELDALLSRARAAGKSVFLLTLTARHRRGVALRPFLAKLKSALDHMRTGRTWRDLSLHGSVTGTEVTHGDNGWHPHFHLLILMDQPKAEAEAMLARLRAEWDRSLRKVELTGNEAAFQLQDGSEAGKYVAKFGAAEEMSLQTNKKGRHGGRSPWQLLEDAEAGDDEAGRLWVEYAKAFFGRRQLVWSKGLKARYQIDELADEELPLEPQGEAVVLRTWAADGVWLQARRRLCAILDAAEAGTDLDAAEFGPTDAERWRAMKAEAVIE